MAWCVSRRLMFLWWLIHEICQSHPQDKDYDGDGDDDDGIDDNEGNSNE